MDWGDRHHKPGTLSAEERAGVCVCVFSDRWPWHWEAGWQDGVKAVLHKPTCGCTSRIPALWPAFVFRDLLYWEMMAKCLAYLFHKWLHCSGYLQDQMLTAPKHRQKNKQNKHNYLCIFSCELQHKVFLTLFSTGQDKKPNFKKLHRQDSTTSTSGCTTSLCCAWLPLQSANITEQALCLNAGRWWQTLWPITLRSTKKSQKAHISVALQWK